MNNTKWRELLEIICQLAVDFEVAYMPGRQFQWAHPVPMDLLQETGITDPGIAGGPARYGEIFAIRVPRYMPKRNPLTGVVAPDDTSSREFLARAQSLGQLPIQQDADYLYIYGYGA